MIEEIQDKIAGVTSPGVMFDAAANCSEIGFKEFIRFYIMTGLREMNKSYSDDIMSNDYNPFIESLLGLYYDEYVRMFDNDRFPSVIFDKGMFGMSDAFEQYRILAEQYPYNFMFMESDLSTEATLRSLFHNSTFGHYQNVEWASTIRDSIHPDGLNKNHCSICEYGIVHLPQIAFVRLLPWNTMTKLLQWYFFVGISNEEEYNTLRTFVQERAAEKIGSYNLSKYQGFYTSMYLNGDYLKDYIAENYDHFDNAGKFVMKRRETFLLGNSSFGDRLLEMQKWCEESLTGQVLISGSNGARYAMFESEEDMNYFKIIWSSNF